MTRKIALLAAAVGMACGQSERQELVRAESTEVSTSATDRPVVLFLGTSLTAGQGVPPEQAYPARIQELIAAAGLPFRAVNAGVSGETSAGGLRRVDWLLEQPVAVLVLELGANDGLRGQPPSALKRNLQMIIDRTRLAHPDARIVIAGMEAPPNLGQAYTNEFRRVFVDLARENHVALIPFLLQDVAGSAALNQEDGIHPTAQGHQIIARNVWKVLEPVLRAATPVESSRSTSRSEAPRGGDPRSGQR